MFYVTFYVRGWVRPFENASPTVPGVNTRSIRTSDLHFVSYRQHSLFTSDFHKCHFSNCIYNWGRFPLCQWKVNMSSEIASFHKYHILVTYKHMRVKKQQQTFKPRENKIQLINPKHFQSQLLFTGIIRRKEKWQKSKIKKHFSSDLLFSWGWQHSHMLLTLKSKSTPPSYSAPHSSPTEPSPSAHSNELLTSYLPLTLRYPSPPPSSGNPPDRQTGRSGRMKQEERLREQEREGERVAFYCWGRWTEKLCE